MCSISISLILQNATISGRMKVVLVPSSIMRKFIYKSGRTQSAQGRKPALNYLAAEHSERVKATTRRKPFTIR